MVIRIPSLDPQTLAVLAEVEQLKKRIGSMLSEPRAWKGLLSRAMIAKAIQGSNTVEGYNVTVDDAIAAVEGEDPLDTDAKTWAEILGYRAAMTYVLQLARDPHFGYSTDLIRSLHFMLLRHDLAKSPGTWRPGYIAVHGPKGEVVYEGPDAGLVPGLMSDLVTSLQEEGGQGAIVRAAMAHLNLVMIHPFRDGNGRMARVLQTLVLARGGQHLNPVFSSIEEYIGANVGDYYQALEDVAHGKWNPDADATPWIRFCAVAHYRQAHTAVNRFDRMRKIWSALEAELQRHRLNERLLLALADAALGYRVRNPTYRRAADISENLASKDLKVLVDRGLLVAHGEKRGRYYVASPVVAEIGRSSQPATKRIPNPYEQLSLDLEHP